MQLLHLQHISLIPHVSCAVICQGRKGHRGSLEDENDHVIVLPQITLSDSREYQKLPDVPAR